MNVEPNFKVNPLIMPLQKQLNLVDDGKRGNLTIAAIIKAADEGRLGVVEPLIIIKEPEPQPDPVKADPKPEPNPIPGDFPKLKGVHPVLVGVIREAAKRSAQPFDVIEGLRTKERQAELVKKGASKTSNSLHLDGRAVDLWPIDPTTGKLLPSDAQFAKGSTAARKASDALWAGLRAIAATAKLVAKEQGVLLEWGGDWGWDAPHFQLNRTAYKPHK